MSKKMKVSFWCFQSCCAVIFAVLFGWMQGVTLLLFAGAAYLLATMPLKR